MTMLTNPLLIEKRKKNQQIASGVGQTTSNYDPNTNTFGGTPTPTPTPTSTPTPTPTSTSTPTPTPISTPIPTPTSSTSSTPITRTSLQTKKPDSYAVGTGEFIADRSKTSTPLTSQPVSNFDFKTSTFYNDGQTGKIKSLLDIRNEIKTQNPGINNIDAANIARQQFKQSTNLAVGEEAITGIEPLDAELAKIKEEKAQIIKDQYRNYTLGQAAYNEKKNYYTNFDDINKKYENVMSDIQGTLQTSKQNQLSDQEVAGIAQKYGLTPEQVKNPLNIYKSLEMSDEGKRKYGTLNQEQQIADYQQKFDQNQIDAKTQLDRNATEIQSSIGEAAKNLQQNLTWMQSSGAWSGAAKSSGYQQGMQNIQNDGVRIIQKLNTQLSNLNDDNKTHVDRIQTEYVKNMTNLKNNLNDNLKSLKFDAGLTLNSLSQQYSPSSKELTKALDKISEEFGIKSLDAFNKYLGSVKSIQNITETNVSILDKMNTLNNAQNNQRFNEISQNPNLLANASFNDLTQEVRSGRINSQKFSDLQKMMTSSIINSLSKIKTVSENDVNIVQNLLQNGKTPNQVLASFQQIATTGSLSNSQSPTQMIGAINGSVASSADMRSIANKYPNEAAPKYNNPAGLTWGISNELKQMLLNAGVSYGEGGKRPAGEGGSYITFPSVADGMKAYTISLTQRGEDVYSRLYSWSAGGDQNTSEATKVANKQAYANGIMKAAGIPMGTKFSELNPQQLAQLQYQQMGRESPGFRKELENIGYFQKLGSSQVASIGGQTGTQQAQQAQQTTFTPYQITGIDKFKKTGDPKNLTNVGLTAQQFNDYEQQQQQQQQQDNQGGNKGGAIMGSIGVPVAFERSIKSLVPSTLMNSEVELDNLNKTIKRMYNSGMNQEDAVLTYFGVDVPSEKKDLAVSIIDKAKGFGGSTGLPDNYFGQVSNYLKKGNTTGAVGLTENLGMQAAHQISGNNQVSENNVIYAVKNANELLSMMNEYEDKFGPISGKWENLTKGWFGNKEAQKLATKISTTIASMPQSIASANMSSEEKGYIKDLIPSLEESAETAKEKIASLKTSSLSQLNSLRETVGLPQLNENNLLDRNKRVSLYGIGQNSQQQQQQQASKPQAKRSIEDLSKLIMHL